MGSRLLVGHRPPPFPTMQESSSLEQMVVNRQGAIHPPAEAGAFSPNPVTKSSDSSDLVGKAALFTHPSDELTYLFSNCTLRLRPDRRTLVPDTLHGSYGHPVLFNGAIPFSKMR